MMRALFKRLTESAPGCIRPRRAQTHRATSGQKRGTRHRGLYAGTNDAATDSLSNLYTRRCIFLAVDPQLKTDKESGNDREGIPLQPVGNR